LGHGAGSEVRAATGVTVFSGMLGVTLFGLFLTPVFYVTLRKLAPASPSGQANTARSKASSSPPEKARD